MSNKQKIEHFMTSWQTGAVPGLPDPRANATEFVRAARAAGYTAYLPGTVKSAARYVREFLDECEQPDIPPLLDSAIADAARWRDLTEHTALIEAAASRALGGAIFEEPEPPEHEDAPELQLINGTDLHIGSGGPHEVDRLVALFDRAIEHAENGILALGGDLLHFDQADGRTTRGTVLETGCDYQTMCERAALFCVRVLRIALSRWGAVSVVFVEGNHDTLVLAMLAAMFRQMAGPRVAVLTGSRPIIEFGEDFFVFDHCYKVRQADMLARIPTMLSGRRWKRAYLVTGHLHHHVVSQASNGVWLLQGASAQEHRSRHDEACAYMSTPGLSSYAWMRGLFEARLHEL